MSGFKVMAATHARKIGKSTGRAKNSAVIVPKTIKIVWANAALDNLNAVGRAGAPSPPGASGSSKSSVLAGGLNGFDNVNSSDCFI